MSDLFPLIVKNFWMIFVLVGLLNSFIISLRIESLVKQKADLKQQGDRLTKGYFISTTLPWLILGSLQLAGGFPNLSYIYSQDLSNIYVLISRLFIVFCILLYLYWIFFRDGAKTLIKFNLVRGIPNETLFKLSMLVAATVSLVILLLPR